MNVVFGRKWILVGVWLMLFASISAWAQMPPGAKTNGPAYTPLDSWSFADTNGWTDDLGHAPISFTNLTSSYLGNGQSLVVDTNVPAWLNYNIYQPGSGATNMVVDGPGTITFWYAPEWATTNGGPGQWSQLIDVGEWTTNAAYGYWGLSVDPPGSNLWFSAQDGMGDSYALSAPISWATNYFHFIVLTYSSTNVSLYLDGQLATNDPGGLSIWPPSEVVSNGVFFGSDTNGFVQAQGMFDSVYAYGAVVDPNKIANTFNSEIWQYVADPFNLAMNALASAPSLPAQTPTGYDAITGQGNLQLVGTAGNVITSSNVWIASVTATNSPTGVVISFTIQGGSNGIPYDVFGCGLPSLSATWAWLGQGYHGNVYQLTSMPNTAFYLILGTPRDSDGDGLTDAYELLVSKTNPYNPDTSGDGMSDSDKVLLGLNPLLVYPSLPADPTIQICPQ